MDKKTAALDDIAKTEKSKLKVIEDLKTQVQAQNMVSKPSQSERNEANKDLLILRSLWSQRLVGR